VLEQAKQSGILVCWRSFLHCAYWLGLTGIHKGCGTYGCGSSMWRDVLNRSDRVAFWGFSSYGSCEGSMGISLLPLVCSV